jgi:hypothetical protein
VVPNPPRVVPDGPTAGVKLRELPVNAADCDVPADADALLAVLDP